MLGVRIQDICQERASKDPLMHLLTSSSPPATMIAQYDRGSSKTWTGAGNQEQGNASSPPRCSTSPVTCCVMQCFAPHSELPWPVWGKGKDRVPELLELVFIILELTDKKNNEKKSPLLLRLSAFQTLTSAGQMIGGE